MSPGERDYMDETMEHPNLKSKEPSPNPPALWNPRAVANLSFLLTPMFGAYLHAENWKALGDTHQASKSMKWFWGYMAFFCFFLAVDYVWDSCSSMDCDYGTIVDIGTIFWWALLFIWRFSAGREQINYVKEKHNNVYKHRNLIIGTLRWIPVPLFAFIIAIVLIFAIFAAEAKFKDTSLENRFEEWYLALKTADEPLYNAIKPYVIEFMSGGPEKELARDRANKILSAATQHYLAVTTNTAVRSFMSAHMEYIYELCDRDLQLCFQCSQGNFGLLAGKAKPNEKEAYIKVIEAISDMIRAAKTSPQPPIKADECRAAIDAFVLKAADSLGQDLLLLNNPADPNLDIAAYMHALRRFYDLALSLPPEEGGMALRCLLED